MRTITMFGAGKSAYTLIEYILETSELNDWQLIIADLYPVHVYEVFNRHRALTCHEFSLGDIELKEKLIQKADLVISMLPASYHLEIAHCALKYSKNLITPSYISDDMNLLHDKVVENDLIFLNEVGLDPGIDHMSTMQMINKIKKSGKKITAYESFTGGLIAPEYDNNPWHYKFTWNPRNVILAGSGGSVKFLHNGRHKYIPYHKLFDRTEQIDIEGYGRFEGIANRDSLKYIDIYGLTEVKTMYRGTLRRPPFSKAWSLLVQIGATDDSYIMDNTETMTYREFMNSFLKYRAGDSVELKLAYYMHCDVDSEAIQLLKWAGLFENQPIGIVNATPAMVLQHLFEKKWKMEPEDKDMIVMHHLFKYGKDEVMKSSMVVVGDDNNHTAMSKSVGLPIAVAAKLILNKKIKTRGVIRPIEEEFYKPILQELKKYGVIFS